MAAAKKAASKKATAKSTTAKKATGKKSTAKKSTAKATAQRGSASQTQLVIGSRVKEAVRGSEVRVSGDFAEALNGRVNELVTKAVERAKANGRATVRPQDL